MCALRLPWLRTILRTPPTPAARVIVFGSAAELRGSPLSGGYAGAKATLRLITGYARADATGRGLTFTTILPTLAPDTGVGEAAIHAYATREGIAAVYPYVRHDQRARVPSGR